MTAREEKVRHHTSFFIPEICGDCRSREEETVPHIPGAQFQEQGKAREIHLSDSPRSSQTRRAQCMSKAKRKFFKIRSNLI